MLVTAFLYSTVGHVVWRTSDCMYIWLFTNFAAADGLIKDQITNKHNLHLAIDDYIFAHPISHDAMTTKMLLKFSFCGEPYAIYIGSGNGLLPNNTKILCKPMLTCCQLGLLETNCSDVFIENTIIYIDRDMLENAMYKMPGILHAFQCVSDRCCGSALRKPADNTGTQFG